MASANSLISNHAGSIWHRWEPHIHTPETALNNQFGAVDQDWTEYIDKVNAVTPIIRVIGVTDYYGLANYEKLFGFWKQGRMPGVKMLFPNIELRFAIGTGSNTAINGHLLICPDDLDHVTRAQDFLMNFEFGARGQTFRCNRADLIKLGKVHDSSIIDDDAAYKAGVNQFKVNFDELINRLKTDPWAKQNILLGLAVGSNDGTSGLANDASFAALRKQMELHADVIFSSSPQQRKFWLGKGVVNIDQLNTEYGGTKPCIHGSDAHNQEAIGVVHDNRFTWIKGDITFEALQQICIEPESRVFIGENPPDDHLPSQTINNVIVSGTDWMNPTEIPINSGLVAVIGARGSGKTALADLIATGGYAVAKQLGDRSFITRAGELLNGVSVKLEWVSGETTTTTVDGMEFDEFLVTPQVQYLSQQFVDRLCSAEGITDELLQEIERVVFNSHSPDDRVGLNSFDELLDSKASGIRDNRQLHEAEVKRQSDLITNDRVKIRNAEALRKRVKEKTNSITQDKESRQKLLTGGQQDRLDTLQNVSSVLDVVSKKLDALRKRSQSLTKLNDAIIGARKTSFPTFTQNLKTQYPNAFLKSEDWNAFEINFTGDVNKVVADQLKQVTDEIVALTGSAPYQGTITAQTPPFVTDYSKLAFQTFNVLSDEVKRLQALIGVDTNNAQLYTRLSEKIVREEAELENFKKGLKEAEEAPDRIKTYLEKRKAAYQNIFESILAEQDELTKLYEPLMDTLISESGTIAKLKFKVERSADIERWAQNGEALLDLRVNGPFKGKGALLEATKAELLNAWQTGTAEDVTIAMSAFREKHEKDLLEHAPVSRSNMEEYNVWVNKIASWLYDTSHIDIRYGIQYDGVDIRQLSPGTRGIVLLLLYLALDKTDERPLIIDQPEENLDPKSVFIELVPLFCEVKKRRQVVIVTHNANLVVNTDADQVIIAKAGAHRIGQLPIIEYLSGGLENPLIRKEVCEILEGGEAAFIERAKRLRVHL